MCDCYSHPCIICGESLPVHLGDFNTNRDEVEMYCGKHIPPAKDSVEGSMWIYWEFCEDVEETGDLRKDRENIIPKFMFIKTLTENAKLNYIHNSPNADCELLFYRFNVSG